MRGHPVRVPERSQLTRTGTVFRESLMGGTKYSLLPLHVCFKEKPVDGAVVWVVVAAVGNHVRQRGVVGARPARRARVFIHSVMGVDPYPEVVNLL